MLSPTNTILEIEQNYIMLLGSQILSNITDSSYYPVTHNLGKGYCLVKLKHALVVVRELMEHWNFPKSKCFKDNPIGSSKKSE
jgi:hypothetical protein